MTRRNTITAILFLLLTAAGLVLLATSFFGGEGKLETLLKSTLRTRDVSAFLEGAESAANSDLDRDHLFIQLYGGVQRLSGRRLIQDAVEGLYSNTYFVGAALLVTGGLSVFLSLFFISILMPLLYRFGPDKARIMIIIVYLFVFLGVIGFFTLLPEGAVDNLDVKFYLLLPVVLLVVLVAALCLSYRISLAIHQKQEF